MIYIFFEPLYYILFYIVVYKYKNKLERKVPFNPTVRKKTVSNIEVPTNVPSAPPPPYAPAPLYPVLPSHFDSRVAPGINDYEARAAYYNGTLHTQNALRIEAQNASDILQQNQQRGALFEALFQPDGRQSPIPIGRSETEMMPGWLLNQPQPTTDASYASRAERYNGPYNVYVNDQPQTTGESHASRAARFNGQYNSYVNDVS